MLASRLALAVFLAGTFAVIDSAVAEPLEEVSTDKVVNFNLDSGTDLTGGDVDGVEVSDTDDNDDQGDDNDDQGDDNDDGGGDGDGDDSDD